MHALGSVAGPKHLFGAHTNTRNHNFMTHTCRVQYTFLIRANSFFTRAIITKTIMTHTCIIFLCSLQYIRLVKLRMRYYHPSSATKMRAPTHHIKLGSLEMHPFPPSLCRRSCFASWLVLQSRSFRRRRFTKSFLSVAFYRPWRAFGKEYRFTEHAQSVRGARAPQTSELAGRQ